MADGYRVRIGEGVSGKVAATRTPLLVQDVEEARTHPLLQDQYFTTGSFISFPLIYHNELVGVVNLTKTLGVEWASRLVRVNAVAPGLIDSSGMDTYDPIIREAAASGARKIPAGRMGTEAEVSAAVVGVAGISGLTAGKNLADAGIEYDCFETSDRIGGNWAFGNPNGHSSAYRSLHIDTSKHRLSFKDFPMPDSYPDFPHHTQIKAYLDAYADAIGGAQ